MNVEKMLLPLCAPTTGLCTISVDQTNYVYVKIYVPAPPSHFERSYTGCVSSTEFWTYLYTGCVAEMT